MSLSRRKWMSTMLSLGAASAVMLTPLRAFASIRTGFGADSAEGVLRELFGDTPIQDTDRIVFKIPDIAENGAVVPVTVSTDMPGVQKIVIVVDENPNPLSASFAISPHVFADVSTRVKMGKSSLVRAVVQTADGVFATAKEVKVTIGGCGG